MTLVGRLDAKKGMRENEHICENGGTSVLIALAVLFANVSIIYYSALLRKRFNVRLIYE